MKLKQIISVSLSFLSLMFINTSANAIAGADKAFLQQSCTSGTTTIENCYENIGDLVTWINNTRKPDAVNPLVVEIGTGTYQGLLHVLCDSSANYTGSISFKGSGSGQTIIRGVGFQLPVYFSSCTEIAFSQLKIEGDQYGAILWHGGGNSKWVDVEVTGIARAWYEESCATERGNHYWFSSKVTVSPGFNLVAGYRATCDESWFFGSEVTAKIPAGLQGSGSAIFAFNEGIIHLYGSVLRVLDTGGGSGTVKAANTGTFPGWPNVTGGEIHIHGTGIDVISDSGRDAIALRSSANGMIHADASAYNLSSSGGQVTRLLNEGGAIKAPYSWGAQPEAPVVNSVNGSDTAVVTNTGDGQPHMLIYSDNCGSKWFDIVTSTCR